MKEQLEIYDLNGNIIKVQARDEFYADIKKEFKETGKVTKQVKAVKIIILTSGGMIYIQKRSPRKKENANLYDKTIGGHVKAGQTLDLTVVQECHEELGFPGVVLNDDDFEKAIKATDLRIIGLLKKVEHINQFISVRKSADGDFKQPLITTFYIGYYDGGVRFCDGESTGVQVMTLEELKQEIQAHPDAFADDLKFMVQRYEKDLIPLDKKTSQGPVLGYEA